MDLFEKLEEKDMHEYAMLVVLEEERGKRTADVIRDYLMSEEDAYIDFMFVGN